MADSREGKTQDYQGAQWDVQFCMLRVDFLPPFLHSCKSAYYAAIYCPLYALSLYYSLLDQSAMKGTMVLSRAPLSMHGVIERDVCLLGMRSLANAVAGELDPMVY